jgi:hypothetical protein
MSVPGILLDLKFSAVTLNVSVPNRSCLGLKSDAGIPDNHGSSATGRLIRPSRAR